jgi:hypothetical protein
MVGGLRLGLLHLRGRGQQPGGGLADQLSLAVETLAHHGRSPGCGQRERLWKTP